MKIAKTMLKDNVPIEVIEKYSGLNREEIEKIKN